MKDIVTILLLYLCSNLYHNDELKAIHKTIHEYHKTYYTYYLSLPIKQIWQLLKILFTLLPKKLVRIGYVNIQVETKDNINNKQTITIKCLNMDPLGHISDTPVIIIAEDVKHPE